MAANNFLAGDLYDPDTQYGQGTQPQPDKPDTSSWNNQINGYYSNFLGRGAQGNEVNDWIGGATGQGKDLGWIQNQIANSPEAQAWANRNQAPPAQTAPPPTPGTAGIGSGASTGGFTMPQVNMPDMSPLMNILLKRANQSLSVNPMTDPILKPQLDAASAASERANRSYLSQAAEHQGDNGNTEAIGRSLSEHSAQGMSQLASSLAQNELTARRGEIQNALNGMGQLLTAQQQVAAQRELGLIDAQLKQLGLNNQNDQFYSNLGLESEDRGNYWDAIRRGLLS